MRIIYISFIYFSFCNKLETNFNSINIPLEHKHLRLDQISQYNGEDLQHLPPVEACQQIFFYPLHEQNPFLFKLERKQIAHKRHHYKDE